MIIYQNNVKNFIKDCKPKNTNSLIAEIKTNMLEKMGRGVSSSEERSWRTTLVKISEFFKQIKEKEKQYILLEFKVPTSQKRIDVILVGSDGKRNTLLIIELKGWSSSKKSEIKGTLKINAIYGNSVLHPNYEAEEYKYLLTQQFSDINKEFPIIKAISLLPNYEVIKNDPIFSKDFEDILKTIDLYTKTDIDQFIKLLQLLFKKGIPRNKVDFLNKLEYKPTLDFQRHLENEFKKIRLSQSQFLSYKIVTNEIANHLKNPKNKKLIIISGMPGSGKTIVAFKILAYIYTELKTTAKLQLPGPEFREAVKKYFDKNTFKNMIGGAYSKGKQQVQIIDEAHKAYANGTAKQFYGEIFKNQNFVISLIDDKQIINKKGFMKFEMIKIAREQYFDIVELELKDQFRNGGDALYIDWLNNWIFNEDNLQHYFVNNSFNFSVLDDKEFNTLYKDMYEKDNVRIATFWTQKWNAEFDKNDQPKKLIKVGSSRYIWNPNEYWIKSFKKNNPNSKVPKDFIKNVVNKNFNAEKKGYEYIAYFNTVQGSEFDYMFVHVPKLFYLNDKNELDVDLLQLDMNDMKSQIWTKQKLPNKEKEELNKTYFKNRLLVLLTRGRKGAFIYCEDKKLSKWLKDKVKNI